MKVFNKMKKNFMLTLLCSVLLTATLLLTACGGDPTPKGDPSSKEDDPPIEGVSTTVTLKGNDAEIDGEGAAFENGKLSITKEGVYSISGTLEDGQIYVNVQKNEKVELYLKGVSVTCSNSSPIYCDSADKLVIRLEEGTENSFTDGKQYQYETVDSEDPADMKPNACIYSDDDISIKGTGTLNVVGQYKNGISSKNDIKFADATVNVTAVHNGVRGKDSITVKSGTITVVAGTDGEGDGFKAKTTNQQGKGFILIEGGSVSIEAGDDGLQAPVDITVLEGSKVTVNCGGKAINSKGTQSIAKGTMTER